MLQNLNLNAEVLFSLLKAPLFYTMQKSGLGGCLSFFLKRQTFSSNSKYIPVSWGCLKIFPCDCMSTKEFCLSFSLCLLKTNFADQQQSSSSNPNKLSRVWFELKPCSIFLVTSNLL